MTIPETYKDFKKEVSDYFIYHFTFGKPSIFADDRDYAFNMAESVLSRHYSSSYVAFERAREGIDGGLYGVFDKIADHFIQEHKTNYINHITNRFRQYDEDYIHEFF